MNSLVTNSILCDTTFETINIYRPPKELSEGNVFSHVCLSVCLSHKESHVAITHDALDLTVQPSPALAPALLFQTWDPQPRPHPSYIGPHPLLVTSGGHHWRPVQTCSLEDPTP